MLLGGVHIFTPHRPHIHTQNTIVSQSLTRGNHLIHIILHAVTTKRPPSKLSGSEAFFPDITPREVRISPPIEGIGCSLSLESLTVGAQNGETFSAEFEQFTGIHPTQGDFRFQRGAIRVVENSDSEWLVELILRAENLEAIAQAWQAQGVPLREEISVRLDKTLIPVHTEGVYLRISG